MGSNITPIRQKEQSINRPTIRLDQPISEVVPPILDALDAANGDLPVLFQRGRALVRVVESHIGGSVVPQIDTLSADSLSEPVSQCARLVRYHATKKQDVETDATNRQLAAVLTTPVWPFPVLEGVSEVPLVRPDGTIHNQPGYDSATRYYYHPVAGVNVPAVPFHPSTDHVQAARSLILDNLLGDFPFASDSERAHAVALLLLPFIRPLISGPTPLHLIESPTPGTGKSLLAHACLYSALGDRLVSASDKADETEAEKWITSKLAEGAPALWIDNIKEGLDNSTLAAAITSRVWSGRVLGTSTTLNAPVRCVWVATANNPTLSTEIARRSIRIRLDAGVDKPQFREGFKHEDLPGWIVSERAAIIHAALTLIRAWVVAGSPRGTKKLGSFESWAQVLGGILQVIDVPGFLDNVIEVYELADVDSVMWGTLVSEWWDLHKNAKLTAGDILKIGQGVDGFGYSETGTGSSGTRAFSRALAKQRDRIYNGYRIAQAGTRQKYQLWTLIPIKQPPTPSENREGELSELSELIPIPLHENDNKEDTLFSGGLGNHSHHSLNSHGRPLHPCSDCGAVAWKINAFGTWNCNICGNAADVSE